MPSPWETQTYANPWDPRFTTGNGPPTPTPSQPTTAKAPGGWGGGHVPSVYDTGWNRGSQNTDYTPVSQPGFGEQWWNQNGGQFGQPDASSQYWNGVQGFFSPNSSGAESALYNYGQQLGGSQGATETAYDAQNASGQFSNPSAVEGFWGSQQQGLMGPSSSETMLGNLANSSSRNYTPAEEYYQLHQNDFSNPGYLEQNAGNIANTINGSTAAQSFWNNTANPALSKASYTENLANGYKPEDSYSEQFLNGGGATGGLDSVYDRLFSTGSRQLDEAAAARGGYNSGAALRATEELRKDTDASHVQALQAASTQADAAKMARLGYGLNLMQGADSSLQGRIGLGLQGAGQVDQEALARAGALQGLYTGVGGERRADAATGGQLAQGASDALNNRLQLAANASNMSGNLANQRISTGGTLSNLATSAQQQRGLNQINAANTRDAALVNRINAGAGLVRNSQDMAMNRLTAGGNLASSAANSRLGYLTGGSAASIAAQQAQENRQQNVFNNTRSLAEDQANAQASAAAAANQEQTNLMLEQINGILASGNVDAQTRQALMQFQMQLMQMGVQGATALGGGSKKPT